MLLLLCLRDAERDLRRLRRWISTPMLPATVPDVPPPRFVGAKRERAEDDVGEELDALVAEGFFNFDDEAYGVSTTQPHQALSPVGKRPAGPIAPMASSKQRVNGWMPDDEL